jgi:hypothetical protein
VYQARRLSDASGFLPYHQPIRRSTVDLLPRGVHREPVLSCNGHPIVISVDHQGQEVQRRVILPGENPIEVVALLWEHLDQLDPEHSRRNYVARSAQVSGLVAAILCTAFAIDRLIVLLGTVPPLT